MLSEKEILNAKEIYLSEHDEILIPFSDRNVGYRFTKQNPTWEITKRWYSWKVYCKALSGEEALNVMEMWKKEKLRESHKLSKAIAFASEKHKNQFRKATTIPYIVHPMEVLQILYSMRADNDLMIAGVLHDTLEDTDTSEKEIKELFGDEVLRLVLSNSEDKSKSWDERKQHTIDDLANADKRVQKLIMADKLSNLRSIAFDYEEIGDRLWKRFNAPKEKQAWYYSKIQDALYDMQFVPECEKLYWEFVGLYKDVFVKYYYDGENEVIFQVSDTGEMYYLKKGSPAWIDAFDFEEIMSEGKHFYKPCIMPESAKLISRADAELTEDIWNQLFGEYQGKKC